MTFVVPSIKNNNNKGPSIQSYGFSSSHVWVWDLDYKGRWTLTNWCFGTVVLEKTLETPLDCKEIQLVHPKGNQSWIFIGRTDAEAETPILWPQDVKKWLIWEDPDTGKDWRQEKKGMTEDVMVGWHHRLDGHKFEKTLGVGNGQGGLACCSSCNREESDMSERLNWTDWEPTFTLRIPARLSFPCFTLTLGFFGFFFCLLYFVLLQSWQ